MHSIPLIPIPGHSEVYVLAILTLYDRESSRFDPAVIITFAAAENNYFTWYRINCLSTQQTRLCVVDYAPLNGGFAAYIALPL